MRGIKVRDVDTETLRATLARERDKWGDEMPSDVLKILEEIDAEFQRREDGIALTSMAHPDGLIDKIADAIRDGRLRLK